MTADSDPAVDEQPHSHAALVYFGTVSLGPLDWGYTTGLAVGVLTLYLGVAVLVRE